MSVTLAAYQDILYCSRPVSRHPKMSIENRAKLFTPFSALRGFDIEILTQEQDRLLMPQISLASDREEEIYRVLNGLHQGDWATVTYFVPVKHIAGATAGGIHRGMRRSKARGRYGAVAGAGRCFCSVWEYSLPGSTGVGRS